MANPEHLAIIKQGVEVWNQWREDNPQVTPDLQEADLKKANLEGANLAGANLERAIFQFTNLKKASLDDANLYEADLLSAELQGAGLSGAFLKHAGLMGAEMQGATLVDTNLRGADIWWVDLSGANVTGVIYDNTTVGRGANVQQSIGSQRFVRHVMDLDYIEETKEKHPLKYWLWKCTSNCGRSILLWATISVGFAVLFGAIFAGYPVWSMLPDWLQHVLVAMGPTMEFNKDMAVNGFTPYYFSIVTFTTLGFGDITPLNLASQIWLTIEVVLGYIMLGGLITLFATKMVRQSG